MNYWLDIRLKIRDFFKKHKKKIIIIIIIWLVIIAINYFLKNSKTIEVKPNTTYKPHSPVMDETGSVPESYKEPINTLIDNYVKYCNNKEYEQAYNLLSDEYKNKFCNKLEEFKNYVDKKFDTKKIYNIQNFSNINDVYIYRVRFLKDILASGTTDEYNYTEEMFVVKVENNQLKLNLNGYIQEENIGIEAEDEFMQIKIENRVIYYDTVTYTVKFRNKTSNYIVLQDGTEGNSEVELQTLNSKRQLLTNSNSNMVILPNYSSTKNLSFEKYGEEGKEDTALILNAIRVLPEFSGNINKAKQEKEKAVKLYSLTINLQPKK